VAWKSSVSIEAAVCPRCGIVANLLDQKPLFGHDSWALEGVMNRLTFGRACAPLFGLALVVWAVGVATSGHAVVSAQEATVQGAAAPPRSAVMPRYDADRQLLLPPDYRRWILAGSSLGLSYVENGGPGQMFHATLMEPTAYEHFVRTGTFREGTMLALILQGIGTNALPARHGQFATDVHGVEMAVKDTSRVPEGWAYYNFGGTMMGPPRTAASPSPKAACYACHVEHAARDNVFVQFYSLLREVAPPAPKVP
jgi:hypothetical protein